MRVDILPQARDDLLAGFRFYERQARGLGSYFRESILEDVDSLAVQGGSHAKVFGYHRSLSKSFPFAIYYGLGSEDKFAARSWASCRSYEINSSRPGISSSR